MTAKVELFIGKGGVGKTTLACATAIARARTGDNVLLASIDQSRALGDVLGVPVAHPPGPADVQSVQTGFDLIEIDSLALLEERFRELTTMLSLGSGQPGHNHAPGIGDLVPEELTGLPGAQELLALGQVVDLANDDEWDTVVVDIGPTVDAIRVLAAPETFLGYLDRTWPKDKRATTSIRSDISAMVLAAGVERVSGAVAKIRNVLADRNRTSARLITVPERVALAETARLRSAAALFGLRLDAVVVNKVLPPVEQADQGDHPALHWYRNRRSEQLDVLAALRESMPDVKIFTAQHTGPEPVGLSSLGALAYAVDGELADIEPVHEADSQGTTVELETGSGTDSVYVMRMHLPVVDRSSLTLGRAEDELIVGCDGVRRRVKLASALRRCSVAGAELDGQSLVVRFAPDPAVWPKGGK